jgi:hypothetical protein
MWFLRRALPILLGLVYVVSPIDAIPDLIPGVGWLDDLLVLGFLVWYLRSLQRGSSPWDLFRGRVGDPRARRPSAPRPEDLSADFTQMDPYTLLEISRGASPEQIKAAYRHAVSRYHPDKVAHLGPEFQELAHKKLLAIQSAYEALHGKRR